MKIAAEFEVLFYQYLNDHSQLNEDAPTLANDVKHLIHLYQQMVLSRIFDAKAIALQRTGKMGTYPSTRGQEAVFVGVGDAMQEQDVLVPYYRDAPTLIQRGVKWSDILLYWGGDERGNCFARGQNNFPFSVPIATQTLHAAGAATAIKIRKEKRAVVCMLGDGGTSEGDFYEAMNVAGVWHLPIVFVINNNQWAISVPRTEQTSTVTLAQKAIAAGFSGEQVDGNDIIAVQSRVTTALEKAREDNEPTLIEMLCYRHSDHTTADDASRYEPKNIREEEWKKEPIARLRNYLLSKKAWSEQLEQAYLTTATGIVDQAVQEYLAVEPSKPQTMFDYLYAELPEVYEDQYNTLKGQM